MDTVENDNRSFMHTRNGFRIKIAARRPRINLTRNNMTDDDFKRHLHRQLEEDKKNHGQLTNRIFAKARVKKLHQPRPVRSK